MQKETERDHVEELRLADGEDVPHDGVLQVRGQARVEQQGQQTLLHGGQQEETSGGVGQSVEE